MYVKRPKPSEDVEDLERAQEEFLASQSPRTSATVRTKKNSSGEGSADVSVPHEPQRKSRFKREREEARAQASSVPTSTAGDSAAPLLRGLVVRFS